MSKICDFIIECGVFYVLTVNNEFPAGRPFGAIMEKDNCLYISTADTKDVYKQLIQSKNVQIIALKPGTRKWIRVSGTAEECIDLNIKQIMLEQCPALRKYHTSANEPHYNVFKIKISECEFK